MGSKECQKNEMSKEEAHSLAMSIATGSSLCMVLMAVIELDVLEIINRAGPEARLSAAQIVAQLPTKNSEAASMLDRMLRLLASNSILTCSVRNLGDGRVERVYGPGPVCKFFSKTQYCGALLLLGFDKVILDAWYNLKGAFSEGGIPFKKAHGMNIFEYLGRDARFNRVFNGAMSAYSTMIMEKILEDYKGFEGLSSLVDVGGGIGTALGMIISKYPNIKGVNYDLPHVIQNAPAQDGMEHVVGDMFVSIPKGDAIFLKYICHDWNDEHCLKLLKNCYVALPEHGKVIVCDCILPCTSESSYASKVVFNLDAKMMVHFEGGKERTQQEFETLAKDAGFQGFRLDCSAYELKVMEFLKKK